MDYNLTVASKISNPIRHVDFACQIFLTISYVVGVLGNSAAVVILIKNSRLRNRKLTFMLLCLSSNNLVALLGMMVAMYLQLYFFYLICDFWKCSLRVVLRIFGLGSGCVAIVMAFERWLALTRPFLCKKVSNFFKNISL